MYEEFAASFAENINNEKEEKLAPIIDSVSR